VVVTVAAAAMVVLVAATVVTPLGVKHALASKALVIFISYMVIIACNIDPF
jgi:hypothetical protein